ncbi:hypothetical protein [Gryllotalpicola koreensis]|uniref:Uncharacterized protein n=1 Tax=Gryllotalpicola koreensis TaxID=993086 RepID=A0ABP7ZWT5_9MICO
MTAARIFVLVWGALAVSWGLFLIIRRNWLSELARELKQQNGMRIAFGSQSPVWMLAGGIIFLVAGLASLTILAATALG